MLGGKSWPIELTAMYLTVQFPFLQIAVNNTQVAHTHIYSKDQKRQLHIFEANGEMDNCQFIRLICVA